MGTNWLQISLSLLLAIVPSFGAFAFLLLPAGYDTSALIELFFQMAGLGLLALAACVFWRLHKRATRPSWPFIFFFAGAINIVVWTILTFIASLSPEAQVEGMVDVSQSFPMLSFLVALIWCVAGMVFGWVEKRSVVSAK